MEPMDEPHETEIHLKDYLRVVVKRKWVVLAVFVAVVTTVAIATFRQRPVYQATAQLQIVGAASTRLSPIFHAPRSSMTSANSSTRWPRASTR